MITSKFFKSFLLASSLAIASAAASASVIVDFTFDQNNGLKNYGLGEFAGTDLNNDGVLTLNELTSFHSNITAEGNTLILLKDLATFGSFNIATNTWNGNAPSWPTFNPNSVAWYSWNHGDSAVNALWATVKTTETTVPEPLTLGLFAIGLLGIGAARRRQQ